MQWTRYYVKDPINTCKGKTNSTYAVTFGRVAVVVMSTVAVIRGSVVVVVVEVCTVAAARVVDFVTTDVAVKLFVRRVVDVNV